MDSQQIGLDPLEFGTHSLRRTKATLIYKRTGNLRAVQLLLGSRSSGHRHKRFDVAYGDGSAALAGHEIYNRA